MKTKSAIARKLSANPKRRQRPLPEATAVLAQLTDSKRPRLTMRTRKILDELLKTHAKLIDDARLGFTGHKIAITRHEFEQARARMTNLLLRLEEHPVQKTQVGDREFRPMLPADNSLQHELGYD